MSDMNLLSSMAFAKAHQLDRDNRSLNNAIDEGQVIINRLYAETQRLAAKLREVDLVRSAETDGYRAELAAWRKEHPTSHMHDVVDKWSNGNDMRRNSRIRLNAIFESAKKLGIRNLMDWITI